MNERLRNALIDAIASGKENSIKNILDEVKGKAIRIRTFLDMMKYYAIYTDPNTKIKVIWELDSDMKQIIESSIVGAKYSYGKVIA